MTPSVRWAGVLIALTACGPSHGVPGEAQGQRSQVHGAAPAAAAPVAAQSPRVLLMPPGKDPVGVRVEVAADEPSRRRGLMFREHLPEDAGMLFLFERPEQLTFWMHNTYIPLDMIFIDPSLRVLGVVENAEPLTDTTRSVPGMSQYVLEVNAGFSRRHGLSQGTAVHFEGVPGFDSDKKGT